MLTHFHRQFAYNAWANREVLKGLEKMNPPPPAAVRWLAHILAAEQLWYTRLQRQSTQGFIVWPEWTAEECVGELLRTINLWESYLAGLTTEMLLHSITYTNTKGEAWQNTVSDILTHVIIHSGYHRGQIAADVRRTGAEPAYTDFIHAVRQGFIEKPFGNAGR